MDAHFRWFEGEKAQFRFVPYDWAFLFPNRFPLSPDDRAGTHRINRDGICSGIIWICLDKFKKTSKDIPRGPDRARRFNQTGHHHPTSPASIPTKTPAQTSNRVWFPTNSRQVATRPVIPTATDK